MGTKLLVFFFFSALVFTTFGSVDLSEFGLLQELKVGKPVSFKSLEGLAFPGSSGELIFCTRIKIPGESRILKPQKFAHSINIKLEQNEAVYSPVVHACIFRNASRGLCECTKENWKQLQKGKWSTLRSPFETLYLDVKTLDSFTDTSFVATATEEFHSYHLVFLVSGMVLMLLSGTLSAWIPFYYSSAMTLGILVVVLILLYQGMKLLPTGRKSTLYILLYGSMIGLGTVVVHYIAGLVSSALSQLGLGDEMLNPLVMFFVLGIFIMGAWLGYWGVRKLVLSEDGRVDIGTAQFVKWTLRLLAAAMLLQSSHDDVFAVLIMGLGWLVCWVSGRLSWKHFRFQRQDFHLSNYTKSGDRSKFLRRVWYRTSVVRTVKVSSPGGIMKSPKTPVGKLSIGKDQDFYSTYHHTPGRKPLTKEEVEELGRTCTHDALKSLLASPEFANWAVSQSDRIVVTPAETREERPEDEIEKTASMEEENNLTPTRPVRKRVSRYS